MYKLRLQRILVVLLAVMLAVTSTGLSLSFAKEKEDKQEKKEKELKKVQEEKDDVY